MVAICTPIFVLTCCDAHLPKAAEPPALFISDTMAPRMTRNTRMPTFHGSDRQLIMPYDFALAPEPTVWLVR